MRAYRPDKFVFISTPKCCTNTIYAIMDEHFRPYRAIAFHGNRVPAEYSSWFKWSVVRSPYTRMVSLWWSACRLHPPDIYGFRSGCGVADDFERFSVWLASTTQDARRRQPLMWNQTDWLRPCEPVHAIHLENLEAELQELRFWKPSIPIPRLNTTDEKVQAESESEGSPIERPPWRELYTRTAREAVLRWAPEDFERFGYDEEEV